MVVKVLILTDETSLEKLKTWKQLHVCLVTITFNGYSKNTIFLLVQETLSIQLVCVCITADVFLKLIYRVSYSIKQKTSLFFSISDPFNCLIFKLILAALENDELTEYKYWWRQKILN